MSLEQTYAALPYVAHAYPQSDPASFGVVARLAGVQVVPPSEARILEIGCAVGGNLAPLAARYPDATCVGIDLSAEQIDVARERDTSSRYQARDLMSLTEDDGPFDYILAHGVYSWVPQAVRDALLAKIRLLLADKGVAYVSYNVLPGWNDRLGVRGLMLQHTANIDDPLEKVRAARQILALIAAKATDGPHRSALREHAARLRDEPDAYLFHDYLELFNHPVSYADFVSHAARDGLMVLGDAALHTSGLRTLDEDTDRLLRQWAGDAVSYESYLDHLRHRAFRQSVLVKAEVQADANVGPERLHGLHLRTTLLSDGAGRFTDGERSIAARDPAMTTLLGQLGTAHPGSMPLPASTPPDIAARAFFALQNGAVTATLEPIAAVRPSRMPRVWGHARAMAARGETSLTNLCHQTLPLPADVLSVARRLDGKKKPRPAWAEAIGALAANAFLDA